MPARSLDIAHTALPSRPPLSQAKSTVSHQSNSVPSTPQQHARNLTFRSRSPSPDDQSTSHSPRSTHSEPNKQFTSGGRTPIGCRFETGMAFSKRRIPYSIGTDKLESVHPPPKLTLATADEARLCRDMQDLYQRHLLPSAESEARRRSFLRKLADLLNKEWPHGQIEVKLFGSSGNLLCTSDSDVDLCITTPLKELEQVCLLAKALDKHGMERVVCVPWAKVPIVKFWDPELGLACDMNVNNTLALENTRMIKLYVQIDERVRPLAMIIKHWTKSRILNDAALGGTLSSYTWICMIINFLQTRRPPVLPSLHQQVQSATSTVPPATESMSSFADDLDALRRSGTRNVESLGALLYGFFRYYAHELDYGTSVISVRQGTLLSKEEKGWHLMQNNSLCVEEPFNTGRNLGNTADETAFRGLHLELRRACAVLAEDAQLDRCCEPYVFPAEEERIWEKPPPMPKPVLSATGPNHAANSATPTIRGGRAGVSNQIRTGRPHNNAHQGRGAGRRSSGSTVPGQSVNAYPMPLGLAAQELFRPSSQERARLELHDQLYQSYQMLQAREHELRWRQMQAQAQAFAQVQQQHARGEAVAHLLASKQAAGHHANGTFTVSLDNPPLTAPLRSDPMTYPLVASTQRVPYYTAGAAPHPSSPNITSLNSPSEVRRSGQRPQVVDGSGTSSLRSHSQPARGGAPSYIPPLPTVQTMLATGLGALQSVPTSASYAGLSQRPVESQGMYPLAQTVPSGFPLVPPSADGAAAPPKEYLGYYVGGSPPSCPYPTDGILQAVPRFADLARPARPRRKASPERRPFDRLRRESRSPSPLRRTRTQSTDPRSRRASAAKCSRTSDVATGGPLIVDGTSDSASISHRISISASTSSTSDRRSSAAPTPTDPYATRACRGTGLDERQVAFVRQQLQTSSIQSAEASQGGRSGTLLDPIQWQPPRPEPMDVAGNPALAMASKMREYSAGENMMPPSLRCATDADVSCEGNVSEGAAGSQPARKGSGMNQASGGLAWYAPLDLSRDPTDVLGATPQNLSPVWEGRTPNSRAKRPQGGEREPATNGVRAATGSGLGKQRAKSMERVEQPGPTATGGSHGQTLRARANGSAAERPVSSVPAETIINTGPGVMAGGAATVNGWKAAPSKGRRKSQANAASNSSKSNAGGSTQRKGDSRTGQGSKMSGEVLPTGEQERKGG